jgi:uncharacterized membrane protein YhdT
MNFRIIHVFLGTLVFLAALVLAGYLVFTEAIPGLYGWKRWFLIAVLCTYGFFRFYRSIKTFKEKDENEK